MNRLQSIIAYFCINYPHKSELSKARLTKMVYLADWYSALADGKKLTDIQWLFNHYGPYVDDVVGNASINEGFRISRAETIYGSDKYVVSFEGELDDDSLSWRDKRILDLVIEKTKSLYFNEFISYVYSTYPVKSKNRYSTLDLVKLANEYREEQALIKS